MQKKSLPQQRTDLEIESKFMEFELLPHGLAKADSFSYDLE